METHTLKEASYSEKKEISTQTLDLEKLEHNCNPKELHLVTATLNRSSKPQARTTKTRRTHALSTHRNPNTTFPCSSPRRLPTPLPQWFVTVGCGRETYLESVVCDPQNSKGDAELSSTLLNTHSLETKRKRRWARVRLGMSSLLRPESVGTRPRMPHPSPVPARQPRHGTARQRRQELHVQAPSKRNPLGPSLLLRPTFRFGNVDVWKVPGTATETFFSQKSN